MEHLSTPNWSPKIEDVQINGCAGQGFTCLEGYPPPPPRCPKKHFTISEVDSKAYEVLVIVQLAIQLNPNELNTCTLHVT